MVVVIDEGAAEDSVRVGGNRGALYSRYLDDIREVIVVRNVTIVQVFDGLGEIAAQFSVLGAASVRVFSPVGLADRQSDSIESCKKTAVSDGQSIDPVGNDDRGSDGQCHDENRSEEFRCYF